MPAAAFTTVTSFQQVNLCKNVQPVFYIKVLSPNQRPLFVLFSVLHLLWLAFIQKKKPVAHAAGFFFSKRFEFSGYACDALSDGNVLDAHSKPPKSRAEKNKSPARVFQKKGIAAT